MVAANPPRLPNLPDDPRKWDGWSRYRADNLYERLCLDPKTRPTNDDIEQHCTALLQWWHKKLPLKNQPSNPLAQLLGRGIDEASQYLVQARMQLLDSARRAQIDSELAARAEQKALTEFARFVSFSITNGMLTAEAEENLIEYGERNGLSDEQIRRCIDAEVARTKAQRPGPIREEPPAAADSAAEDAFRRILELSEVNLFSATESVRRIFATIAQNLGLESERAEWLLDDQLEKEEREIAKRLTAKPAVTPRTRVPAPSAGTPPVKEPAPSAPVLETSNRPVETRPLPPTFVHPLGGAMVLIPGGDFIMGSDEMDAAPNEQPLTPVKLSDFYIARHPITNAQYEQFDRSHRQKRMHGAGDGHPVVYVTSHDAVKFCNWLGQKDGRKYRLPTEAEWEFAARGTDGRKYPWGNQDNRGDLANFADASTSFPWRDARIHDGFPESSPIGAFPRGASFFGIEDMAGNVWEWCLDFFQPLAGVPKQNPRGAAAGAKRIHRGGSWKSRFSNLRATARASNAPNYSCNDLGFRIVCECGSGE
ncbi:MAG TPA: SUMF1/EgtB/PvdO family nonheme iron enzyme [Chthoniobacterales bacterium]|nr:SUMF1/EgtB/PvdO family nonheme iron enzyme [Chthoniobacterales bacterium]